MQQRLPYGHWTEWVDDRLPYDARTAQRYMSLHEMVDLFGLAARPSTDIDIGANIGASLELVTRELPRKRWLGPANRACPPRATVSRKLVRDNPARLE